MISFLETATPVLLPPPDPRVTSSAARSVDQTRRAGLATKPPDDVTSACMTASMETTAENIAIVMSKAQWREVENAMNWENAIVDQE